ncbi:MAG: AIPR family protein [Bacteroidetes bacterium]|nr:AIPR family protein [Bacteroidota bacterium]
MSSLNENIELNKFYSIWMQDIASAQLTDEEGSNSEQLFTQYSLDLLAEAGEVENYRLAYDEKALGTAKQHKINAFSISENYETVDLFISIFKGTNDISKTTSDEIEQAGKRVSNFFRKAIYSSENEKSKAFKNEYIDEIEESSEIFQFAHTLGKDSDLRENLIRVNATLLTNGIYTGELPETIEISGYKIYFKVFDIFALYNASDKSHIPIEINFKEMGFDLPCIESPSLNTEYQSYLAIVPGEALAKIYDKYGARLLEQNVRSFLQVGGKKSTNYGIRKTIIECPEMFLAYNNGLTTTADEIVFEKRENNLNINVVKDFQIVNGGQTTASIFHTLIKDKADISKIFVQMKMSVIKNKEKFSDIVANISAFANTQNKVSIADLSSNKPFHIEIEKLSRSIVAPNAQGQTIQTFWFYERARGQYKNARVKEGTTKSRQKSFDLRIPKKQVFTKEDLAKYINSFCEKIESKKIVIGPHFVVRGNQKNYLQFINNNLPQKTDNVYYEDLISKAILFRAAEKVYGVKPNSIGDMRYITVPYALAIFNNLIGGKLNLYKIWKNQDVSNEIKELLYTLMIQVEQFIKNNATGGLYGEWAKKEECWVAIKEYKFSLDLSSIKDDIGSPKRIVRSNEEIDSEEIVRQDEIIKAIHPLVYSKIERWGRETNLLTLNQMNIIKNVSFKVKQNSSFTEIERRTALLVLEIVAKKDPEALEFDETLLNQFDNIKSENIEISIDLIKKIVNWDKKNKRLKSYEYTLMNDILEGKKTLTELNKKLAMANYNKVKKYGFVE